MLKKTITYKDFNDNTRTEDFFFHLTKAEITEMQLSKTGGFVEALQRIIDLQDGPSIIEEFKKLVLKAYGVKSEDGRRFIKSKEVVDAFAETEAYSQIFMSLFLDAEAAAIFLNGIMPGDLSKDTDANLTPNVRPLYPNPTV